MVAGAAAGLSGLTLTLVVFESAGRCFCINNIYSLTLTLVVFESLRQVV